MKKPMVIVAIIFLMLGSAVTITTFKDNSVSLDKTASADYQLALGFMKDRNYQDALTLIRKNSDQINQESDLQNKWLNLLLDVSTEVGDIKQLSYVFEYEPSLFKQHEAASLLLAEEWQLKGNQEKYDYLRAMWKEREVRQWEWLNLDVENLVLQGKRFEAIQLVNAKQFLGHDEDQRILLLAMLYANEAPQKSIDFVTTILNQNPHNPALLGFRGSLYEKLNDSDAAFSDYMESMIFNPQDCTSKERLSAFYFKQQQYPQIISLYENSSEQMQLTDSSLIKLIFWNKLIKPLNIDFKAIPYQESNLKPYIGYLASLKESQYWNKVAFDEIEYNEELLQSQQEAFWLQLIAFLMNGNELEAESLLRHRSFQENSWHLPLERGLLRLIKYRKEGSLQLETDSDRLLVVDKYRDKDGFFTELENMATLQKKDPSYEIPKEYHALLMGPLAYSIAFLSAGFNEASLDLNFMHVIPSDYPEWVVPSYVKVIEENREDIDVLNFLYRQPTTDLVNVLKLKYALNLSLEKEEEILSSLDRYTSKKSEAGKKASLLVATIHLKNGHLHKAREAILSNKSLSNHYTGAEILAKIALREGDFPTAGLIYEATKEHSLDAQSYLARIAFSEKDWENAKKFTLMLLKKQPNNDVLQNNFIKIFNVLNDKS